MEDLKVIKRDGKLVDFDTMRIITALENAYKDFYNTDKVNE